MDAHGEQHRVILQRIAHRVMLERGLLPDFSSGVLSEVEQLTLSSSLDGNARDLRGLLWASIDNDDSLDLDQLSVAESLPGDRIKILVAIADVSALVTNGTAIDAHARHNTTSVYTAAEIFPMLPEKLSTGLTSLNFDDDRLAMVVEFTVEADGSIEDGDLFPAKVCNRAKLAYNSLATWLEGQGPLPTAAATVKGLDQNLRLQDAAAKRMHDFRHRNGALSLETIESHPIFDGDSIRGLEVEHKNRARNLIEDLMIAANGVTARFLAARKVPSIRRVVRSPKRWERIVEIAGEHGVRLPAEPDARALEAFLANEKTADPLRFPDLSLSIIKLLGAGEYVAELPDDPSAGHFGLAVKDYTHSTAPNRRYTDLLTQRLVKSTLAGAPIPYSQDELEMLAQHCTEAEDAVNKVERQVGKSAAALLLADRIGEHFDAIVTGAAPKGTWVRLLSLPVEGKLVSGFHGLDVGHRLRVELESVDVEQGYIDFKR